MAWQVLLLPDAESLDELSVSVCVLALQIIEQTPTLANQLQKAAARMVILGVRLEVFRQLGDSLTENSHLDLGRASVFLVCAIAPDERFFLVFRQSHGVLHARPRAQSSKVSDSKVRSSRTPYNGKSMLPRILNCS